MKFKKNIVVFLLTVLMVAFTMSFNANAATATLQATVSANSVNVRSGAGTSYSVVKALNKKAKIALFTNALYNSDWYHIQMPDGKKGYMHKDYVKINKNQLFIPASVKGYSGYTYKYNLTNTTGKSVKWSISDKKLATIKSGVVTCLKSGTVTVAVKAGDLKVKSKITISDAEVKLSKNTATIFSDETLELKATCVKKVKYTSSDKKIATVDSNGVVTPLSEGTVTITAKSNSGKDTCSVTIKKRAISLSTEKTTLYKDCYAQMTAKNGLQVYTYTSSNPNVITVTNSGLMYAVGEGTVKITCKSGDLTKTKTMKVVTGASINISHKTGEVNRDMTLYIKSTTKNVKWKSSNESVATVDNGFILGKKQGTAIISVYTDSGESTCLLTVTDPRPVRFVYTSENSVLSGSSVTFYAITDNERTGLKFKLIAPNGSESWITNTSKTTDSNRYIWSAKKTLTSTGVYRVEAYSKTSGSSDWASGASGYSTFMMNSYTSKKTMGFTERRASTALINDIASFEGFLSNVTPDALAGGIPTVGYGRVIYAGTSFYNGMLKKEAYAYLVNTVNESGFTSRVNKFLIDNEIKFNQRQFDALVDFSYNLGAYAITNYENVSGILLNTYGKDSNDREAFVNCYNAVLRKGAGDSYGIIKNVPGGTDVLLVNKTVYNDDWYKIKLSDDTTGYILKSNLTLRTTDTNVRNLNNVELDRFADVILPYHHASGDCYWGLLYRRIDEVEMFFFGDYEANGKQNNYNLLYACSKDSSFKIS